MAANYLERALAGMRTYQEAEAWAQVVLQTSQEWRVHPAAVHWVALCLCRARNLPALRIHLQQVTSRAELGRFAAWLSLRDSQPQLALQQLTEDPEALPPVHRSLWWRCRAEAMAQMQMPGWEEAYAQARQGLEGPALGRVLLDEAVYHHHFQQLGPARLLWSNAIALLNDDYYYQAWLRYNLGISYLGQDLAKAEGYFLGAEQLTRKNQAKAFRPRALCGLASVRLRLGEWERALAAYREATKLPADREDQIQAHWGVGHTLRLMGRVAEAFAHLLQTQQRFETETWLHVDLAACTLMLGDAPTAQQHLAKASKLQQRGQALYWVVQAEILRLQGQPLNGVLSELKARQPWAEMERYAFPQLMAYLGLSKPNEERFVVEVNAGGPVQVKVNGREVPLRPTARSAELLVLLLEGGGSANLDRLIDAMYPQAALHQRSKTTRALWDNIRQLRWALGWEESVQALGGTYRLDPAAEWRYSDQGGEFCQGIYSEWVLERRLMSE